MTDVFEKFSSEEVILLSTALAVLVDSKYCSRKQDGRFKIICADGKKRNFDESFLTSLGDKIGILGGLDSLEVDARDVASEVFRR